MEQANSCTKDGCLNRPLILPIHSILLSLLSPNMKKENGIRKIYQKTRDKKKNKGKRKSEIYAVEIKPPYQKQKKIRSNPYNTTPPYNTNPLRHLISIPKNLLRTLHQILPRLHLPPLHLLPTLPLLLRHQMRRHGRNRRKRHIRTIRRIRHPRPRRIHAQLIAPTIQIRGFDAWRERRLGGGSGVAAEGQGIGG